MSSVKSYIANQPVRQFVSAAAFNNDIFTYTIITNPTTNVITGTLAANVVGATSSTCPAGRILRDNGLKLYPGVNVGVNTYMIGVYDSETLLSGYIDPNSPVFAVYSTQLPAFYANGVDPGPQGLDDEGPPVYTNGNIISVSGDIITETGSITAATSVTAGTSILAGTSITSTLGNITAASGEILGTKGLGFSTTVYGGNVTQGTNKGTTVILNAPTGTITMNNAVLGGGATVNFTFTNNTISANDMLLLMHGAGGTIGAYVYYSICAAGGATIWIKNITGGNLGEAVVLQFMVLRA